MSPQAFLFHTCTRHAVPQAELHIYFAVILFFPNCSSLTRCSGSGLCHPQCKPFFRGCLGKFSEQYYIQVSEECHVGLFQQILTMLRLIFISSLPLKLEDYGYFRKWWKFYIRFNNCNLKNGTWIADPGLWSCQPSVLPLIYIPYSRYFEIGSCYIATQDFQKLVM